VGHARIHGKKTLHYHALTVDMHGSQQCPTAIVVGKGRKAVGCAASFVGGDGSSDE